MSDLIKPSEAARMLGCCRSTVHNLINSGRLASVRVTPKLIRVRRESVLAILRGDRWDDNNHNN